MNILITGGRGFIGRHAEKLLVEQSHHVMVFDKTLLLDVFDREAIQEAVCANDVVLHLVGQPDMHQAQLKPQDSFDLNVLALNAVLEACRLAGTRRIVLPSSASVYGATRTLPVNESQPVNPSQIYAYHKLMEEQLVQAYRENYGIEYVILRLFNVYGRGSRGIMTGMIEKAKKGERMTMYGEKQLRDWVHVGDVAHAMSLATTVGAIRNRIVNIGTGNGYSISEIASLVAEETGLEYDFKKTSAGFVKYDSVADISIARHLMGWEVNRTTRLALRMGIREQM